MIRRLSSILLTVMVSVVVSGHRVSACSCVGGTPACGYIGAGTVAALFVGDVVSIVDAPTSRTRIRFRVIEPFLGVDSQEIDVFTGRPEDGASCAYYEFESDQPYLVFARKDQAGRLTTGLCGGNQPMDLVAPSDLEYLRDRLQASSPTGTIEGRVQLETSGSKIVPATPFPGARIVAEGAGRQFEAVSGDDGRYQIPVPAGSYTLRTAVGDGLYAGTWEVELADPRGCAVSNTLVRPDGHITGRLVDSSGAPIAGISVDAVYSERLSSTFVGATSRALTDADGRYDIGRLPAGEYVIGLDIHSERDSREQQVFLPGTRDSASARRVPLVQSGRVTVPDFVLPPELSTTRLEGVVQDARGGAVPGASVLLFKGTDVAAGPVTADDTGRFSITVLAGRPYRLRAELAGELRRVRPRSDVVTVEPGDPGPFILVIGER
jgi:hypothetical protein